MTETFLQILTFLFSQCYTQDLSKNNYGENLVTELIAEGFDEAESRAALLWLQGLKQGEKNTQAMQGASTQSLRIYTEKEMDKMDLQCRGFIFFLEKLGLIDTFDRELMIDRAMALDIATINLEEFRYIANMILLDRNRYKTNASQLCQLVMSECGAEQ